MWYQELLQKRDAYQKGKAFIPELTIASYERSFEIEYTHNCGTSGGVPSVSSAERLKTVACSLWLGD